MKNLQLFALSRKAVNVTDEDAKHIAFVNDKVYVLRNNVLTMYEDGPGEEVTTITCNSEDVIQFEYLTQEQLLWIGAKSEFVCVNLSDKSIKRIESESIAAESESSFEFASAVWNPTKEAFVTVTLDGELCVFEVNFEQQLMKKKRSCNLHDELPRVEQLGWGLAQLQFRSPVEVALMNSFKDEEAIPEKDHTIKISWRENAEQFAVNYRVNGIRKIRVYDYLCNLLHESENVIGLQSAIAWEPIGNCIAGIVWTTERCQLTMFEKNCWMKCSFDLAKTAYVYQLKWGPSGEVLAVQQSATEDSYTTIDLYYFNNYEMYLKQRLQFQEENPLIEFEFIKSPDTLCVLRATTLYEAITYSFKFVYHCSQATSTQLHTTCVSINGSKALVTRCENGMRPPPMFDFVVDVASPINFVTFHPYKSQVALIDCYNVLTVFEITNESFTKLRSFQLEGEPGFISPLKFHQFVWVISGIFCVGEKPIPQTNHVDVFYFVDFDSGEWEFTITATLDKNINYSGLVEIHENMLTQTTAIDKFLSSFKKGEGPCTPLVLTRLHMSSVLFSYDNYVFSLSSINNFYINDHEILQGVISFIIYGEYLFLTLVDGRLFGARFNQLDEMINHNFTNVYYRPVERGASLICVIPGTSNVVIQIPSGNIETCTCQCITIDRIERLLENREWAEALDIARVEKLNLNVISDLNFTRFLACIRGFIEAVKSPSSLSEFLLALEDKNIFNSTYSNCGIRNPETTPGKRNLICNAMIKYMEQHNHVHYINTIITACFVKDSPTAISEALHYVQSILNLRDEDPSVIDAATEAFKSAHTLKSNKEIYETALLMYDLDLILFVARNIEMDPLEFEPFIGGLKMVDSCRCRFQINDFLNRHFEALQYLVKSPIHDKEVLDYIKEHNIYERTLWCVQPETTLYIKVSRIVGEVLRNQHKYEEALIFFHRAKLYQHALDACKRGLLWKQAVDIMQEMHLHRMKFSQNLRSMAADLKSRGRIKEASQIYEKYLNDYKTAIMMCIENKLFSRAIKLARKYNCYYIYESDIVDSVNLYCSSLCDKFKLMLEEFLKYKTRFFTLRTEIKSRFENQDVIEIFGQPDHGDHDSKSTSSHASSHICRKPIRYSLQEGSVFEDIALLESLYNLIYEAFDWGPKARELCLIILNFKNKPTPSSNTVLMCNLLSDLQTEMRCSIQEIWPPHINISSIFKNVNLLDPKYSTPPGNTGISWKLDIFPSSLNLVP